ncbi:tyrosine-type recombinase/integrase [Desulforamulus aquiferis]|uniref:Site-specific integrase n=1 Tax=Desulforamulus aquiferis TaxID=1397668 RepID=A0AAW7ZAC3_9FIRM|nr:site-specific integrase [Desulforamulus aquiferis]MDO7786378.1 site-specific integrase [Desulforamulus aquiferis]
MGIVKRGNSYTISVYLGRDALGKKKYYYETFKGTPKEAKLKEAELKLKMARITADSNMTVDKYLDFWLEQVKLSESVQERTLETYAYHVAKLKPKLSELKLNKITTLKLQTRLNDLGDLAPHTVKGIFGTLRTALRQAMVWELLPKDYTVGLKTPRTPKKEREVLKLGELQLLLEVAKDYKHYPIIRLLSVTGMRIGECLGLKWKDIDFTTGKLTIKRAADSVNRQLKDDPKTETARRTIIIDKETLKVLMELRKNQEKSKISFLNIGEVLVFHEDGRVVHHSAVRRTMNRVIKKARLHHIRLHDLRHTAGSLILDAGYAITTVSNLLGHSSPSTTAGIYAHAIRKGINVVDALEASQQQIDNQQTDILKGIR